MKVLCLGGGPAGLYFAISMKLRDPAHEVTLLERNKADDTFGWGVVLSDDALGNMERNDPDQHGRHPRQLLVLGRHRSHPPRCAHGVGWPRLRRPRPDEDAAPAARASSRAGCRPAVPVHVRVGGGIPPRVRPGGRLRRHQLAGARRVRRCVQVPTSTRGCASSSGSARTRSSTTRSPSSSRRPSTAGCGCTPTSSTPNTATVIVECTAADLGRLGLRARCRRRRRSRRASASSRSTSAATR
jgi:hypothetical protein